MLSRTFSTWGRMLGLGGRSEGGLSAAAQERRLSGRIPCDIETTCQQTAAKAKERIGVRVVNVSRGGISMEAARSFELGELLSVALPGREATEVSELLACVVYSQFAEGHWQVGCTFATQLSDDDLMRFGGPFSQSGDDPGSTQLVPDQRSGVRFSCQAQAAFTLVGARESAPCPALVINVSASGIALQVPVPLSVGDLLSVELRRGAGEPVVVTLASVVRTTVERDGGRAPVRVAGCNFIRELPEEQLRLLH